MVSAQPDTALNSYVTVWAWTLIICISVSMSRASYSQSWCQWGGASIILSQVEAANLWTVASLLQTGVQRASFDFKPVKQSPGFSDWSTLVQSQWGKDCWLTVWGRVDFALSLIWNCCSLFFCHKGRSVTKRLKYVPRQSQEKWNPRNEDLMNPWNSWFRGSPPPNFPMIHPNKFP